jgi:undecaprenyl diphosphate synthase
MGSVESAPSLCYAHLHGKYLCYISRKAMAEIKNQDLKNMPRHIAIIMDGNGRWAAKHMLGRIAGHQKGAQAVSSVVTACRESGVQYLTLYALSVENLFRPSDEVSALMTLLEKYLRSELPELLKNDIRLMTIGNIETLRASVKEILKDAIEKTAKNKGMVLNLALSYGGRDEIVDAARKILADCQAGVVQPKDLSKELFSGYLYTSGIPDPDLLIRTSGEYRLSNFLLWQTAYTELYFTSVLWPDFSKKHLMAAIADFQGRERRFGLTSDQI